MSSCELCGKLIEGPFVNAGAHGKYHAACFKCSSCAGDIKGGFKKSPTGLLTCAACASSGSDRPVCYRCKQKIGFGPGEEYRTVQQKYTFHNRCANCSVCGKTSNKTYWQHDDLKCPDHAYV